MTDLNASQIGTPGPALRPVLIVEDENALYAGSVDPADSAALVELLHRAFLIGGQPGSGKSCMAQLLAVHAALDGADKTIHIGKENPDA